MRVILILMVLISYQSYSNELLNDSYGSVKIGMLASEALPKLKGYVSDKLEYDKDHGCYYLLPPDDIKGVYFMVIGERISRFDIYHKVLNVHTLKDVGIGSSKSDVLKAYPNTIALPHEYMGLEGEYLHVKLPNGNGIIFETAKNQVTDFRLGSYPAIEYIEGCL